ncbi:uncharacterized protein CXorf66 homolog [Ovis aries]|uniref:Uncharacterized protein n=2 Tax=Ovis aries TaxID=9940 RepID=A0A6P3ESL9_SHEEP|nr:uncharacterized protein CXorf66 homolog [Ovis aries]KAG5193965.1 hypothetical protein JEQ12_020326 [Ovis aries]
MNLFIYVLLLSIWTNSCLDRNESNGSATAVTTRAEFKQTKLEELKRRLLIVVIGALITGYIVTCSCFLHYSCDSEEAHNAAKVKKEDMTIKASRSSKISFTDSKSLTAGLGDPEKQSMVSRRDKSSGPSSPREVPSSTAKLIRPSSQKKTSKPSAPKKVLGSPPQEKLHRTRSPKKAHRQSHAHKLVGQVSPSYPKKVIKPTWPSSLQCRVKPTKTPLPYPKNQSFSEQSSVDKLTKRQRYLKLKYPASAGRAEILSRTQPVKFCRCYKEKCLVCTAVSEPFITHISEANIKHVPVPLFSRELKHFYKSYKKKQSKYNTLHVNMSDTDITTYNSDDESDREVTILCNIKCKEDIYKNSRNN